MSFFLVRPHTPLAFYVYEQSRMRAEETNLAEAFSAVTSEMHRNPLAREVTVDPYGQTTHFARTKAERLEKRDFQKREFRTMKEIPLRLLWWGMYNSDVVMAVSNWIAMAENYHYGNFEEHASRWAKGERDIPQLKPQTEAEIAVYQTQKRIKDLCVSTLRKFIEEGGSEHRNPRLVASAAEEFYASCQVVEQPHPEKPEEKEDEPKEKGKEEEKEEEEKEEEEKEEEEKEEEEEYIVIRVPRSRWALLAQAIHNKKI